MSLTCVHTEVLNGSEGGRVTDEEGQEVSERGNGDSEATSPQGAVHPLLHTQLLSYCLRMP